MSLPPVDPDRRAQGQPSAPPEAPAPRSPLPAWLAAGGERARLARFRTLEHVLFGESIIDSAQLWTADPAAVDHLLRLNGFLPERAADRGRLEDLLHEATEYLIETHHYRLPLAIEQPAGSIEELMLRAAEPERTPERRCACMVLKAICILHHIGGHELLFNTAISEADLFARLSKRVFAAIDDMRKVGVDVREFAAGKKSRTSLATKLLAKRTNLATQIFDRLRFRVVVRSRHDLVHALAFLLQHLVPFNYVLPEQSENSILQAKDLAEALELDPQMVQYAWQRPHVDGRRRRHANEFSAKGFHTINFVADIPLRIDSAAEGREPAIVFVQTEIQLLDLETAQHNEEGEAAHARYKSRQRAKVRSRLEARLQSN